MTDVLAAAALEFVEAEMVVGVGGGRTASRAIVALADWQRATGLSVQVAPTSDHADQLCREVGLAVVDAAEVDRVDVVIDGADEVDRSMRLLKGSRGAVVRERILARSAEKRVYMVPAHKVSGRIGTNATMAVVVMPFGLELTRSLLREIGLHGVVRRDLNGQRATTDNGNLVLDVALDSGDDLSGVSEQLLSVPGVVEHGLFLREADVLLIEHEDGAIERLTN